jgi:hypothetical protein
MIVACVMLLMIIATRWYANELDSFESLSFSMKNVAIVRGALDAAEASPVKVERGYRMLICLVRSCNPKRKWSGCVSLLVM